MDEQDTSSLEATIAAQAREIEELKAKLAGRATSRRTVLKGAGAMAGGLAAIGAMGAAGTALAASPAAAASWDAPPTYGGAFSGALSLKINGADVAGEDPRHEGSIEFVYYQHSVTTARDASSGLATGKRVHNPIIIRKHIDKATPLLLKALVQNQSVDGIFKFFRPNTDGQEENFYTVEIKGGRIATVNELSPDNVSNAGGGGPGPLEEVSFTFNTIKWRFEPTGVEFQDGVSNKA